MSAEPGIQRVNVEKKGRHYVLPGGKMVPSVTNVLSILDKPALIHWAAKLERDYVVGKAAEAFVYANRTREEHPELELETFQQSLRSSLGEKRAHQMRLKEAGDIGTSLHEAIQIELKERLRAGDGTRIATELSDSANVAFMAWQDWAESVELRPTLVEEIVGSSEMGAAGTLDNASIVYLPEDAIRRVKAYEPDIEWLVCDEAETVFDWKTSRTSKSSPTGIYPEALIQVSVYRHIAIEMELVSPEAWAAVVRLPKSIDDPCIDKGKLDVRWIPPVEAEMYATGFRAIRSAWTFMKNTNFA